MGACCAKCCPKKEKAGVSDIERHRSCKDVICLVVFIVSMVASIGVGIFASTIGKPATLVYGSDYLGNTCGDSNSNPNQARSKCRSEDGCKFSTGAAEGGKYAQTVKKDEVIGINYETMKYVTYPRLNEDIYNIVQENGGKMPTSASDFNFYGVCLDKCPEEAGWVCSSYGHALLVDNEASVSQFSWKVEPGSKKETVLETCKTEAEATGAASAIPSFFVSLLPAGDKCSQYLQHCFYTPVAMTEMFYRCFPNYNTTKRYGCDDDGDGIVDPGTERLQPYEAADAADCAMMLEISTSQKQAQPNFVYDQISTTFSIIGRMIGDVQTAQVPIFVTGTIVAILLGFAWLLLLRYCAMVFVWLTILVVILLMIVACIAMYVQAEMIPNPFGDSSAASTSDSSEDSANAAAVSGAMSAAGLPASDTTSTDLYRFLAIAMTIVTVVQLVVIVALKHNINVAARIIQEASKAMASMPLLSVFPLPLVMLIIGCFAWFVYNGMCLISAEPFDLATVVAAASSSNNTNDTAALIPATGENSTAQLLAVFQLFIFLWQNQFVQGIGMMTVSGSICTWYWTPPRQSDGKKHQKDRLPICGALARTLQFHMGSVAMGSFLVALVQLLRIILAYIDSKTKKLQGKNAMLKCLMKIVQCLLMCFEKCVKFISRNAYILIAQKGYSFCHACRDVFSLLTSHMGQISATTMITNYLMLLGKIVISGCALGIGYIWLSQDGLETTPTSMVVPLLLIGLLAFGVASAFLTVYDIAIDTILVLFLIDKDNNDGSPSKPYYMSVALAKMEGVKGITAEIDDDGNIVGGAESDGKVATNKVVPTSGKPSKVNDDQGDDDEMV